MCIVPACDGWLGRLLLRDVESSKEKLNSGDGECLASAHRMSSLKGLPIAGSISPPSVDPNTVNSTQDSKTTGFRCFLRTLGNKLSPQVPKTSERGGTLGLENGHRSLEAWSVRGPLLFLSWPGEGH